ncbi:MAG: PAS domain-containing protein [Burkholderiaceae bacterium]
MSDRTVEEQGWLQAVESATFGVWDLDPRLEMVHYPPQWKARLGFPRIHAPDSTAFWRCRVHPDDFDAMLGALRAHLDGHSSSYEMRFRLRSNGSGYRTVLSRGRVVARDHRGDATRMVGTMVDLTGRRTAAAPHGLAGEDPEQAIRVPRLPLHAVLGVACLHAGMGSSAGERSGAGRVDAARDAHKLIGSISDLLDRALLEGSATH